MNLIKQEVWYKPWEKLDAHQKELFKRRLSRWILPSVFVLWLAILSITSPVFLTRNNIFKVARQVAVIGILSLGQLLVLITGNIDLSIGTFVGLFGAVLAGFSLQLGFWPAFGLALLLALVWGLMNGFLVTR